MTKKRTKAKKYKSTEEWMEELGLEMEEEKEGKLRSFLKKFMKWVGLIFSIIFVWLLLYFFAGDPAELFLNNGEKTILSNIVDFILLPFPITKYLIVPILIATGISIVWYGILALEEKLKNKFHKKE